MHGLTETGEDVFEDGVEIGSGSLLPSHRIGVSRMLRVARADGRVRDLAGERRVDGARRMLRNAHRGGSQRFSRGIVASALL